MVKRETIGAVRKQLQQLKQKGVPNLIREGNEQELINIKESIDYSIFEQYDEDLEAESELDFILSDLSITTEDDVMALAFYVYCNPFIKAGDISFFFIAAEFFNALEKKCDEWGKELADVLHNKKFILSNHSWLHYSGLTMYEFLHPKETKYRLDK